MKYDWLIDWINVLSTLLGHGMLKSTMLKIDLEHVKYITICISESKKCENF